MLDLSVLIVSWNVRDLLRRCLRSIFSRVADDLRYEVIVLDSASTDGSPMMVRDEFPQVCLIAEERNVGFTAGNNRALALSQGRHVLLLNPDTEVLADALEEMVRYMDAHPDVGVVGPQLLNPDGTVQSSRRRFPTLATAFLESTVLQKWFPDNPAARRYYVRDRSDDQIQDVDWVTGACLMARRGAIEDVGPLDEGFFMYSEELDWCYRIKEAGWRVAYLPTAQVVHHEAQSSEQVKTFQHIQFQRSKVRFFAKHHGAWQAELIRAFLLVTYVYELVVEALKWLVGHKRPLRTSRMRAYWEVLHTGLR